MNTHTTQTTIAPNGTLQLSEVPFAPGARVEVTVREAAPLEGARTFPLRGTEAEYREPFEPAVEADDWDAS